MEECKQKILDKGYVLVEETEAGISFVNEEANFCAILLKNYYEEEEDDEHNGHGLHKTLRSKYPFAEKSTILIVYNFDTRNTISKNDMERNPYHFLKIFPEKINILPKIIDKNIKIVFAPMKNSGDTGDYTIDPYDYFDGLCCVSFLNFLATAKNGDVVKYPKIVENNWFRYWANKLYSVEVKNDG